MIFELFQRLQSQIIFVFQKSIHMLVKCILNNAEGETQQNWRMSREKKRNRKLKFNVQFVPFNRIHESRTIIQMSNQIRFNSLHPKL